MARRIYTAARRRIGNLELALAAAGMFAMAGIYSSIVAHL